MKRFYCAYQCEFPNKKKLASTYYFSESQNLIHALNHFGGTWVESCGGSGKLTYVQLCESKKKAEDVAAEWNESFRQNGTYAFDH